MPTWVAIVLAISFISGWGAFLYARKLANDTGSTDGEKPIWLGGISNSYRVAGTLKSHARAGNRWAALAYRVYCVDLAIIPALLAALIVSQVWPY